MATNRKGGTSSPSGSTEDPEKYHLSAPYALSVEDVLSGLETSPDGLSAQEAQHRLESGAHTNALQESEKDSLLSQFLGQFQEPLILLLLGSAAVSFFLKQYDDAICITVAILLVCTVSFVQEYNSEKTIEALKSLVVHSCVVVRNRRPHSLRVEDLVPGDVVIINSGDRVPADVRFIEATDLTIDESMLTGEAKPCRKVTTACAPTAELYERNNTGFMGSVAMSGYGKAVVVAIGAGTELGKMASEVDESEAGKSPLQKDMAQLGQQLSIFSFAVIIIICVFGFFQGNSMFEMFTVGVSLAVAAIPEGLPIVTTVTLALGCQRMARRKALIRKLPAVEALGATSAICSDKTGTLTRNEMNVRAIYLPNDELVEVGSIPPGTQAPPAVKAILNAGVMCNNASLDTGSPTERALIKIHDQYDLHDERRARTRKSEVPFSSDTKWMATEYPTDAGNSIFYVKGSPEAVLLKCKHGLQNEDKVHKMIDTLSKRAFRVLAIASGPKIDDLTFLGLVGMSDPPREGVREAITVTTRQAGIKVVMITGDSEPTALAIATELGIISDISQRSAAMSGSYLQEKPIEQLAEEIEDVRIFYRVTPSHKRKIVECMQRKHVVAMTGDGVNDAPALKRADVGVAMGSGQDVAKEAAEMVLVNDNFVSITAAIEEGRSIYNNIRNFLRFQLTTSVAAMACIAACTVLNLPMPLNATQILLINIIMDGPPAQSLGLEPSDIDVMHAPPRDTSKPIVSPSMIFSVVTSAAIMIAGTVGIFNYNLTAPRADAEEYATTLAFTTFVLFQAFNALNCRSPTKSIVQYGMNKFFFYAVGGSVLAQIAVTSVPFLMYFFETVSLTLKEWGYAIAVSSTIIVWDEVRKAVVRATSTE